MADASMSEKMKAHLDQRTTKEMNPVIGRKDVEIHTDIMRLTHQLKLGVRSGDLIMGTPAYLDAKREIRNLYLQLSHPDRYSKEAQDLGIDLTTTEENRPIHAAGSRLKQ